MDTAVLSPARNASLVGVEGVPIITPGGRDWDAVKCDDAAKVQLHHAGVSASTAASMVQILGFKFPQDLQQMTPEHITRLLLPPLELSRLEKLVAQVKAARCSSLRDLAACLAAAAPGSVIDLGGAVLTGSESLPGDALAFTQPGTTLRNGVLQLSGAQHVTVSAADVVFEGVNIVHTATATAKAVADAAVAVQGPCGGLRLLRCAVRGDLCTALVGASRGAVVKMEECQVNGTAGMVACALERGSQLKAQGTTFSRCRQLLTVQGGSIADLSSCHLHGSSDASCAALVTDAGSTLLAADCKWRGNTGDGLRLQAGGSATLHDCTLAGSLQRGGVRVTGAGTSLSATASSFCDNQKDGVVVLDGARASLEQCPATGNLQGGGMHVGGAGTAVRAAACTMQLNQRSGASVHAGASLEISGGGYHTFKLVRGAGVVVEGEGASLLARDCYMTGRKSGLNVMGGAHAQLQRCGLTGHDACASSAKVKGRGSRLDLIGSTSSGITASRGGVVVTDAERCCGCCCFC